MKALWLRHRQPGSSGQTMVEFALILPVLLMIMMGVIEFGRVLFVYSSVNNAAREAVRYGMTSGLSSTGTPYYLDCTGIRQAAKGSSPLLGLVDSDITIQYDQPNTSGGMTFLAYSCGDSHLDAFSIQQGYRIVVTVTKTVIPLPALPIVGLPTLSLQAVTARTILKDISINP